jgi:hypothetical protein
MIIWLQIIPNNTYRPDILTTPTLASQALIGFSCRNYPLGANPALGIFLGDITFPDDLAAPVGFWPTYGLPRLRPVPIHSGARTTGMTKNSDRAMDIPNAT